VSWGGVITGLGICLVIICVTLCIHAYWVTAQAEQSQIKSDKKRSVCMPVLYLTKLLLAVFKDDVAMSEFIVHCADKFGCSI